MTLHSRSTYCFGRLTASFLGHVAQVVLGLILMVVGVALSVTVYLTPLGFFVGVLGLIAFMTGREEANAAFRHLREEYWDRHRHEVFLHGQHHCRSVPTHAHHRR